MLNYCHWIDMKTQYEWQHRILLRYCHLLVVSLLVVSVGSPKLNWTIFGTNLYALLWVLYGHNTIQKGTIHDRPSAPQCCMYRNKKQQQQNGELHLKKKMFFLELYIRPRGKKHTLNVHNNCVANRTVQYTQTHTHTHIHKENSILNAM